MPAIYIQVVALLACIAAVDLTPRLFLLTVAKRAGYVMTVTAQPPCVRLPSAWRGGRAPGRPDVSGGKGL